MGNKHFLLLFSLLLLVGGCRNQTPVVSSPATEFSTPAADAKEYEPAAKIQDGYATVKDENISFTYKADDYTHVVVTREKKLVESEPVPGGNYPAYRCFHLKDKRALPALEKGGRYFFPARSKICIIPLTDVTEKDFAKAYPDITEDLNRFRQVLSKRPDNPPEGKNLPDLPLNNAGRSISSRFQFLDFRSGAGFLLLTQYTQEDYSTPVNNEELTCQFQGLTNDGKYYVSARMAITHPSLPKGIDFTDHIKRDDQGRYLKNGEQQLNTLPEDSFQPSLVELKKLFSSISIE